MIAILSALGLVMGACVAVRPAPLDVPPGYRVVLGRVDLSRFEAPEALLEIVREDGGVRHDLRTGRGAREFLITLPPGQYRISRVRLVDDRKTSPTHTALQARVVFEVPTAPAVYLGTLRLVSSFAGQRVETTVADEYEDTVPALRARQPGIPEAVVRSLFRPS